MQIDVSHVAKLARLGLSEEEKILFAEQLSTILNYANNLQKIDTKDVPPTSCVIPMKNVFREDKTIPYENINDLMANAPAEEDHMFLVPRILE